MTATALRSGIGGDVTAVDCDVVKRRRHSPDWAVLLPLGTDGDYVAENR